VLTVVHVLADADQIFQHQHRVLDRLGVLYELTGYKIWPTFLQLPLGGEVGFVEPTNGFAIMGSQAETNWRTRAVAVTHIRFDSRNGPHV